MSVHRVELAEKLQSLFEEQESQLNGVRLDSNLLAMRLKSLQLLGLVAAIEQQLSVSLSPALIFEHPQLQELADFLLERFPDECSVWMSRNT